MVPPPESARARSTKSTGSTLKTVDDSATSKAEHFNYPADDAERQEESDPFFPSSTKNDFLDIEAAVKFYHQECKKNGLLINNSFVRYLRSGSVIMEFDNGYLGENGIIPIMNTLRHVRLMKLILPKCALQDEEIHLICDTLYEHPTIESLDLRGNKISVSGSKSLLRLLMKNKHITEIFIDSETPKSAALFRQAADNGTAELRTFACLVCYHPVVYTLARQVEMTLLKNILSNFTTTIERVSGVQVEVLFRLILVSLEAHNGTLSLCSEACVERMSRVIYESLVVVLKACYVKVPYEIPNNHVIRQCLPTIINDLKCRRLTKRDYCGNGSDDDDSEDIEHYFDNAIDQGVNEQCSICGQKGKYQRNGVVLLMKQLIKEIDKCQELSSSGLLRLCHLMIAQVGVKPCSGKCTRQLVRFGMYGFYGVIRAYPKQEPLLTSTGTNLDELPEESFSVTDFNEAVVDRLDEEETTCALTVASAMEDIDGVPIDPYMIFAIGRHLRHQASSTIGMELQTACEAVHLVGCLAQSAAPFNRRKGDRPPRRLYADWEDWDKLGDVQQYLYAAFSRRRVGVYCVDGPHGNAFDNIRAALWAFRRQRRSVVLAMKFSYSWLVAEAGVVPETSSAAGGFYTSIKVIGQTVVNNTLYMIVQGNFGPNAGHQGFFYFPKSVFNRHITHNAYIFVDIPKTVALDEVKELYAAQLITPFALSVVGAAQEHRDLFSLLEAACRLPPQTKNAYGDISATAPPALSFIANTAHPPTKNQSRWIKYFQMLVAHTPMSAQIAHYLNEICPLEVSRFFHNVFSSPDGRSLCVQAACYSKALKQAEASSKRDSSAMPLEQLEWTSVSPEYIEGAANELGAFIKKKPKKKSDRNTRGKSGAVERKKGEPEKEEEKVPEAGSVAFLRDIWETEQSRLDALSQKPESHHCAIENMFPYACCMELNKQLAAQQANIDTSTMPHDPIQEEFIGRRWNLLHIVDEQGKPSRLVLACIYHSACVYDLTKKRSLFKFDRISSIDLLAGFPFFSGFDTCFHHPQKPQHAFVFSNNLWFQWDAHKQQCILGPFETKVHPLFSKLPARFQQRVDCTISVPDTPYVFFITQKSFILFNMETATPEGPVQLLNRRNTESALPVALPDALLQSSAPEPMTTYWKVSGGSTSIVIVCSNGEIIETTLKDEKDHNKKIMTESSLRHLPMVFQQMTNEAVPYLCEAIISKYFQAPYNTQLFEVERFDHQKSEKHPEVYVEVFATHMVKTHLAEKYPKSLLSFQPGDPKSELLSQEVHYYGKPLDEKSEFCPVSTIEYDFGESPVSFSGVLLFLEVSKVHPDTLQLSPLTVAVESSIDQITYRTHTTFRALKFISYAYWSGAHVARFWRIKFVDVIPEDVGIAKVFWYKAKCAALVGKLPVLEPFIPAPGTATISVASEMILRPATQLWNGAGGNAVFAASSKRGWYDKHAVLPLLPAGTTCLFFCGSSFVEYNMSAFEVVAGRSMDLQIHPAFSSLPAPFNTGFDAVFYPDIAKPDVITIVRDGYEIQWSLSSGTAEDQPLLCTSGSFNGVNIDMTRIYDIMNVWNKRHEVDVVFILEDGFAGVLRWNLKQQKIVLTPRGLQHFPHLHHAEFDGKPLLCLFSTPRRPKAVYVFCETKVANFELLPTPQEVKYTKQFFRLSWRLTNWSKTSTGCVMNIDFLGNIVLLLGLELVSSSACGMRWSIEYSDDNINWLNVGIHVQDKPRSCTTWLPRHVDGRGHRFWRLAVADKENVVDTEAVAYKLLSFLVLPLFKYIEPSKSKLLVSTSSKDNVQKLFRGGSAVTFDTKNSSVSLHRSTSPSCNPDAPTHHLTLDYGSYPAHLASISSACEDSAHSDQWTILSSDDGKVWNCAGSWRRNHSQFRFSWFVGRSYRFWRIEIQTEKPSVTFKNFALYGYKGPFLALNSYSPLSAKDYPSLVPLLYESNAVRDDQVKDYVQFRVTVGSVLSVDTKATTAAVIGVALRCIFSLSEKVEFVVEHSDDIVWWFEAARFAFFSSSLESSAFWNSVGSHRYWRLRVISTSCDGYMLIKHVLLSVSQTNLYRMYLSQKESRSEALHTEQPECVYFNSPTPVSIVRIEANLPPNSLYVVEKLGLDSISWNPISLLENPDLSDHRVIDKGWDSPLPSCSWRLRFVEFWDGDGSASGFPSLILPVKWYSFTNRRLFRVPCEEVDGLKITLTRFNTLEPVESLHLNRSGFAVLQVAPPEITESEGDPDQLAAVAEEEQKKDEERKKMRKSAERKEDKKDKKKLEEEQKAAQENARLEKEKKAAVTKLPPKPDDPSIMFTFRYPTRLSQVFLNSTLPAAEQEEVSGTSSAKASKKSSVASLNALPEHDQEASEGEGEEVIENQIEFGPNPPMKVVVEASDNAVDFTPLSRGVLISGSTSLAWCGEECSKYWRLRFENVFDELELKVHAVKWFTYLGVSSIMVPSEPCILTNSIYSAQLTETFNYDEEFCMNCRLGFNQAKSQASKLREEDDIDKIGEIAKCIWQHKKAYQAFISKVAKSAARNPEPPAGPFFGSMQTLAKDINYFLHMTSIKFPDSGFGSLIKVVGVPLVLKDVQYNKKDSHWFYPSFEITGPLMEDIYGFSSVSASFSVLWSLSGPVQRDLRMLEGTSITCVSAHLASPLITLSIESTAWNPVDHFPFIPFLYHGGYPNKPTIVVFALNEVMFTDKYYLRTPVTGKAVASQPFRIAAGVNFVRVDALSQCPAPVFNLLKWIYPDSFLECYRTPLVLSVSSLRCRSGKIRFTLPGTGVTLGIEGLEINFLEFEISMMMFNQNLLPISIDEEGKSNETSVKDPELLYGECEYQVSFVSHGATFRMTGERGIETIPIALSGSFDKHGSPVIQITGLSMSSNIPLDGIRETRLTAIKLSGIVSASDQPQCFLVPRLVVSCNLVLPCGSVFPCHFALPKNNYINVADQLYLDLWEVNLEDLISLSFWARTVTMDRTLVLPKDKSIYTPSCSLFASLEVDLTCFKLHGLGTMKLFGEVADNAEILVDSNGFGILSSLPHVRAGNIELVNAEQNSGVVVEVSCIFLEGSKPDVSVHLAGASNFFSVGASTKMHLSRKGCVCLCSTPYFDVGIEENSTDPMCRSAKVILHNSSLLDMVISHLKSAPMIVALLAHGLPFCLSNEKLTAGAYSSMEKRLTLCFSGVFFGSFFEVSAPSFDPTNLLMSYDALCELLALRTVEECQDTIWASYGSVVGCLQPEDVQKQGGENNFVSRWKSQETLGIEA